jgi:5-methylcytosine-specific restriction endonuclease McrA
VRHRPPERAPFIRENVFLRDRYSCQYCGDTLPAKHLTLDHVQPLSKGGGHNWENVVTACSPCNNRKGNKTPDGAAMPLQKPPKALRSLSTEGITSGLKEIPDSWREFLPAKTG